MSEKDLEVLKAYREVSGYTIGALNDAIENLRRSLASDIYEKDIRDCLADRLESIEIALDAIENDSE